MLKQRKVEPRLFRSRKRRQYWSARVTQDGKEKRLKDAGANDWYAVVDEIGEGVVRLEIASWPELDQGGHLRFATVYEQSYPLEALQRLVNRARTKHGQPAPDRPLRIGDAFRIQSNARLTKRLVSPKFRGTLYDITDAAREQAKIALHGAVARRLKPVEARARKQVSSPAGRFPGAKRNNQGTRPARIRPAVFDAEE